MTVTHADLQLGTLAAVEIGRGAYATVYRACLDGVDYAVKAARPDAGGGEDALLAFRREAGLLARINHPGVPRVFDVGRSAGRPYLVMEYIDGRPLTAVLASGPLAEAPLRRLAVEVAGALGAAHRAGLVHRDVKPANILIDAGGAARMIDFGLAAAERAGAGENSGDVVAGTFDYSAPEQTGMLARPVDGRADLYALGAVLYECATGQLPFRTDDAGELIRMHATVPAPDPRDLRPELSPELAAVIGRLLAKDPDDRYADANGLATALGAAIERPACGLVGRDRELGELRERWRQALAGAGGFVLVEGGAGTGRRALTGALAATVAAGDALLLTGRCVNDDPTPLAAVRAAVDRHVHAIAAGPDREAAVAGLREAAGVGASLLAPLSPALAELLDAPALDTEVNHIQFSNAVAAFLAGLGRAAGGLLLQLDDVQWLDPAGLTLLRQLATEMTGTPLLVLATAGETGTARFREACGARLDLVQRLGPIADADAARLVAGYLAGAGTTAELIAEVTTRGCGNPLTILEFLRALLDAGALYPRWGAWVLDTDLLHAIQLPEDVLGLVLARLDAMSGTERQSLTTAAVIGSRFTLDLLAEVTGRNPAAELAAAAGRGLVTPADGRLGFTHEQIREALLQTLGERERRATHQRIADVLDGRGPARPAEIYAVARHYAQGETSRTPERVFTTGSTAGLLALDEHAPQTALEFLRPALDAATAAGLTPVSRFQEALGRAYLGDGRADPAIEALTAALATATEPIERARILLRTAAALRLRWDIDASTEAALQGLAETGYALPRTPAKLIAWSAWRLAWWIVAGNPAPQRRDGDQEGVRIAVELNQLLGINAIMSLRPAWVLPFTMNSAGLAAGPDPADAYARGRVGLGVVAALLRMGRRRDRHFDEAQAAAATLPDPATAAFVAHNRAVAEAMICGGPGDELVRTVEENRRWLEPDIYLNVVSVLCMELAVRGYVEQAATLYRRTRPAGIGSMTIEYEAAGSMIDAVSGLPVDAAGYLGERCLSPTHPARRLIYSLVATMCTSEQGDLGPVLERAVEEFGQVGAPSIALMPGHRLFFLYVAFDRLELARQATGIERERRAAEAVAAVRRLGRMANNPLLRAHYRVAKAGLAVLAGKDRVAMRLLARAEDLVTAVDAPTLEYEVARIRARALLGQGRAASAARQAQVALVLATEHGWVHRARWIRAEFDGVELSVVARRTDGSANSAGAGDRYRRRLEALQQVSLAAANVLRPEDLARVALDETLRILGAERAVLFLTDERGHPQPSVGRTTAGDDVTDMSGYSRTLVDRVARTREAVVVTGSEQGAALGSRSALVYGLRSIMAAPLELDDRLLGVVYLDSRVAKGMFTDNDVDILTAVNSHIAVSLETARAAQLEVAVRTAHQQRDVAERLRDAIGRLTGILDPDRVRHVLLEIVTDVSPAQAAYLVYDQDDAVTVTPAGAPVADLRDVLAVAAPTRDDPVLAAGIRAAGWMAVPLRTQTSGRGVLVAVSDEPGAFGDEHLQLIAAIAGHAATAYENAELYRRVQRMATTDALTGVANRRHFTDRATDQLATAARDGRRLTAMMIDIDHFKKVNDTYGHATGDAVIRGVADLLRANVRDPDVVCRYGGEEFAILLADGPDPIEAAERLRRAVREATVHGPTGPVAVTVSIGVADLTVDDDLDTLLGRADAALYRAKENGRDQVQR